MRMEGKKIASGSEGRRSKQLRRTPLPTPMRRTGLPDSIRQTLDRAEFSDVALATTDDDPRQTTLRLADARKSAGDPAPAPFIPEALKDSLLYHSAEGQHAYYFSCSGED